MLSTYSHRLQSGASAKVTRAVTFTFYCTSQLVRQWKTGGISLSSGNFIPLLLFECLLARQHNDSWETDVGIANFVTVSLQMHRSRVFFSQRA